MKIFCQNDVHISTKGTNISPPRTMIIPQYLANVNLSLGTSLMTLRPDPDSRGGLGVVLVGISSSLPTSRLRRESAGMYSGPSPLLTTTAVLTCDLISYMSIKTKHFTSSLIGLLLICILPL